MAFQGGAALRGALSRLGRRRSRPDEGLERLELIGSIELVGTGPDVHRRAATARRHGLLWDGDKQPAAEAEEAVPIAVERRRVPTGYAEEVKASGWW